MVLGSLTVSAVKRGRAAVALVFLALSGACRHRATRARAHDAVAVHGPASGLYWARLGEQAEGVRVQLWLDSDGARVRGSYRSVPWEGEFTGRVTALGALVLHVHELGLTRALGTHERQVRLLRNGPSRWSGIDDEGHVAELIRVGFASPTLRPGLWLSHWSGLPTGLSVETHLTRDSDGVWRASYQYQGPGGLRDGSFEGRIEAGDALRIRWMELSPEGTISRGHGLLRPSPLGLFGSFGADVPATTPPAEAPPDGEWSLEPLEP